MALTIEDRNFILQIATTIYVGHLHKGTNITPDEIVSEAMRLFDAVDKRLPSQLRKRNPVPHRPAIIIEGKQKHGN